MRMIVLLVCMYCFTGLMAQQKPKTSAGAGVPAALKTAEDSVQYAAGIYIGQWIMANGFTRFDPNTFMSGIEDRIRRKNLPISDSAAFAIIENYKQNVARDISRKLEADLFAQLKDKPGIGKLPSGVQYSIRVKGTGIRPSETDSVVLNFRGILADGSVFEDTWAKKILVATTPKTLMPGMNESIQMMPAGSVWELYIPSEMAYGEKGNGNLIPPNSALVILVELVSVKRNS